MSKNIHGWVAFSRQLLEEGWLKNHKRFVLWSYLLLKAQHHKTQFEINYNRNSTVVTETVELNPGQLIIGREKVAERISLSEQNIRTLIKRFVKEGRIITEPTNNYTKITIVNWLKFQPFGNIVTNNSPSINHDLTTYNNVNNENKKESESYTDNSINDISKKFHSMLIERNYSIKEEVLSTQLLDKLKLYGKDRLLDSLNITLAAIDSAGEEGGRKIGSPLNYVDGILRKMNPDIDAVDD